MFDNPRHLINAEISFLTELSLLTEREILAPDWSLQNFGGVYAYI